MAKWMRNWVTLSMISGTKKQITAEMAITQKHNIPVMATGNWTFPVTELGSLSLKSLRNIKIL
ncbi:hypothetical protein bsdcttw_29720 [Anaerocolumna chitinilytica]|uniref:Uncharacterized protein n=1 Tax=Anaerocolumna chitinilytica TaxID=1727145 RepID=A0A7I8DRP7_9FIRM|nr:hypothetical protein bsdcttw_29720 [Anaerocolumna chitinilytica]